VKVKVKVALLSLVALLMLSTAAEAAYFLPFGQARRVTKIWVREACDQRGPSCATWKVGHCARINPQRVDCAAYIIFHSREYCVFIVENRVKGNGYIHQRRRDLRCNRA
jgi:hypothetical protein